MADQLNIGFLIFPGMTQLDVTGPAEVLSRLPGAEIHMIWKERSPVAADAGFTINPTTSFADCSQLDVICVCGGMGVIPLLSDSEVLDFLKSQADGARYLTSVCTGSLLLGAAGLLQGYRSACHWAFRDELKQFGAEPVAKRIVRDRNRLSGGGVTAGIDFGLVHASELGGEELAKIIQLSLEYDPEPPFDCGSPGKAGPERVASIQAMIAEETA
ncbi:hypothetical protein A3194_12790 [Candidatus Thiodiazotropha endoloripes]|uniref:DJ-1/PfpI family protein n=1 Tax=Candidatus Thiodiazotropha endoloripes TaxID=1818881 RepID=UPI00083E3025|nr:DJ-1/PfpI family protein [Candidatus Thiodiazotropha endoloripes]MCG7984636.1 DJ-1/PfpI family protein [Candidatus Thiodiazotropha lotti]ODB85702.1 hypothetical protein A3194_12790 [Candidatus Thiodiazotropha endoloripes]